MAERWMIGNDDNEFMKIDLLKRFAHYEKHVENRECGLVGCKPIKKSCEFYVHYHVCVLHQTVYTSQFRNFFGSYEKLVEQLASICEEFKKDQ